MIPQLSLVIPSIRPENYQKVYDSFMKSFSGTFEIIFVSPYELPKLKLQERGDVRWIRDFGCPSRCLQIGWLQAKAHIVSFATDDCIFDKGAMDKAWRLLDYHRFDYKTVIVCKYTESDNWSKWMMTEWYYWAKFHADFRHKNIPWNFKLYMNGLISKQLLEEMGGFDCKYESMAYTYNDFSMRAQFYSAKFIIAEERSNHCSWLPGTTGDHGPVANACTEHDTPLFRGVYHAKCFKPVVKIKIDNWRQSAERWPRRFK